jgi:mannitol/fructose-specific phosphotransferase system IIA component (Ntr-type)
MESMIRIPHRQGGEVLVTAVHLPEVPPTEAINRLAHAAAELLGDTMTAEEIQRKAAAREDLASSAVADAIAFPHATSSECSGSAVVVGISPTGISWDPVHANVHLVVLFAGRDDDHLDAMATVARLLRTPALPEALLAAASPQAALQLLKSDAAAGAAPESGPRMPTPAVKQAVETLVQAMPGAVPAIVAPSFAGARVPDGPDGWPGWFVLDPKPFDDATVGAVEREVARAAVEGHFGAAHAVVVVWGEPAGDKLTTLRVVPIGGHRPDRNLPGFHPVVIDRVERLAREIAREGREGKPVGCFFVVAPLSDIADMTHQLIVNPFQGYPREARNILDPSLEETIKEFSKIDGAFVIAEDGTVESAGTYIAVSPRSLSHSAGNGTRHASARAVTAEAHAVAVVVSESTGRVSVYFRGQRLE